MGLDGDPDLNIVFYGSLGVKNSSAEYGDMGEKGDLRMMIWQTKLRKENPMHADTHKPVNV
jgi:hypothetical protein